MREWREDLQDFWPSALTGCALLGLVIILVLLFLLAVGWLT
jgi:hypothetical protein